MLQEISKQPGIYLLLWLMPGMSFIGCRPDSSTSEEKSAYLADYESPADHWGFIDTTGQLVIPALYDEVAAFYERKAAVNKSGLWGYIDHKGKEIILPQFMEAYAFHEGIARVKPFELPACYVTSNGKIISSNHWIATGDFSDGRALVKVGSLYGYIDSTGDLAVRPAYSRAWNFEKGIALVEFNKKQSVIDTNGKYIIHGQYDHVNIFVDYDLIIGNVDHHTMIWKLDGTVVDSIPSLNAKETDGLLVSVLKNGKMQFYDLASKTVLVEHLYDQIFYLGEHRWCAKQDTLYYLIDENGKLIGNTGYNQINKFSNKMAVYRRGKFWGYIDVNGKELTESVFGLAWDYKNGFARAAFKDGIGFINSKQQLAFYPPAGSVEIRDFSEGMAPVQIMKQ